jgi:hypothetical protein
VAELGVNADSFDMVRVPVPEENQDQVLLLSRRRCCICFGLYGHTTVDPGQIAHLDRDNTNSDLDNLAFLCLAHHDQYDGKTSQSKGLRESEVKQFRTELYGKIAAGLVDTSPQQDKESPQPAPGLIRKGVGLSVLVIFAVIIIAYKAVHADIPVYPAFRRAWSIYHEELGEPTSESVGTSGYEAWHEHATVIWVAELRSWLIMPNNSRRWREQPDISGWTEDLRKDVWLRAQFQTRFGIPIPEGKGPPFGGLANLFFADFPGYLKEVGWRDTDCVYEVHSLHLQSFQKGWIVGNFHHSLEPAVDYGDMFVLLKNGQIHATAGDPAAPYVAPVH